MDFVLADTAGRQHTHARLMEELKKIYRVSEKALGRAPDEVLLVLDAVAGQNAIRQAEEFTRALPVTGIILAKLDSTSRGGAVLTIRRQLGIPVKLVGLGEKADQIAPFDPDAFVEGLLGANDSYSLSSSAIHSCASRRLCPSPSLQRSSRNA